MHILVEEDTWSCRFGVRVIHHCQKNTLVLGSRHKTAHRVQMSLIFKTEQFSEDCKTLDLPGRPFALSPYNARTRHAG